MTELWAYRVDIVVPDLDLTGFDVEANDGHIGKIDEASEAAGDAWSSTPGSGSSARSA